MSLTCKKFQLLSAFLIVAAAFLMFSHHAYAAGPEYCAVLAPPNQSSSPPANSDCITYGQNYNTSTIVAGAPSNPTSDQLKAVFIANMNNYLSSGYENQKVGAQYITGILSQNGNTWIQNINNPAVTLSLQTVGFTQNTGYDPTGDRIVPFPEQYTVYQTLILQVNGITYYEIKTDCGNPVGTWPPLPRLTATIKGQDVDSSGQVLNINPSVNIVGIGGASLTSNPFDFPNNTSYNLQPNSTYTMTAATTAVDNSTGQTYQLKGYSTCSTSNCNPNPAVLTGTGNTATVTTPNGNTEAGIDWVYAVIPTQTIPISGTVETNNSPASGITVCAQVNGTCVVSNTTGSGGNYSLNLKAGTSYQIVVTNIPTKAVNVTLNSSRSSYFSSPINVSQHYVLNNVSSSTPTGGWTFDYFWSTTGQNTIKVTGNVQSNGQNDNKIVVCAEAGGSCVTSDTTGTGGNFSLTLTVGENYQIVVTNIPSQATGVNLNQSLSSYFTGSGTQQHYAINPADGNTPLGGWTFDYTWSATGPQFVTITGNVESNNNNDNSIKVCAEVNGNCLLSDTTGPGGNFSLTLTVGASYDIVVTNIPSQATSVTLDSSRSSYFSSTINVSQHYVLNNVSSSTPTGGWTFDYYWSTIVNNTLTITGNIQLNNGNEANMRVCAEAGGSCVVSDTTGPGGNFSLKLTVGDNYQIVVTNISSQATEVTLNSNLQTYFTGGGVNQHYAVNPVNGNVPAGGWNFDYTSTGSAKTITISGHITLNTSNLSSIKITCKSNDGGTCHNGPNTSTGYDTTGSGGNYSLVLTEGYQYDIQVTNPPGSATGLSLNSALKSYWAGSGTSAYYTISLVLASTPTSNWDFAYTSPGTGVGNITISGNVSFDQAGATAGVNGATVSAYCLQSNGTYIDCTGAQPSNGNGGTINKTGVRGNYQLKLQTGNTYLIYVTFGAPATAQTLTLNPNGTSHPVVGTGLLKEYHPTNVGANLVTTGWDFLYGSSSNNNPPGGNGCNGINFNQVGTAVAPAAASQPYTLTTYTYNNATQQYGPGVQTTQSAPESFSSMTINYSFGNGGGSGAVGTSQSPTMTFNAGSYYGFNSVTFTGMAYYTSPSVVQAQWIGGPQARTQTGTVGEQQTVTNISPASLQVGVCGTPVCKQTIPSNNIGTGRQFGMTLSEEGYVIGTSELNVPSPAAGDHYNVTFSGGSGNIIPPGGDKIGSLQPYTPGIGLVTYSSNETVSAPGGYGVTWQLTGTGVPTLSGPCSGSFTVANEPYVSVAGGDVVAGSGTEPSCAINPGAGIFSWNGNDGFAPVNFNQGAGTQFGTFATGQINGFSSAQGSSSGGQGSYLAFSNTNGVNTTVGNFGGNFGAAPCAYNYASYDNPSNDMPWPGSLSAVTKSGTYIVNGSLTLDGTLQTNLQVTIYVTGDVYIDGPVTYAYGTNNDPNLITSLHVISEAHSIDIDSSVNQLYGSYVAQMGKINTCADQNGVFEGTGNCSAGQLTVYGSFVANQIELWRTYGTYNLTPGTSDVPSSPAEQFNYSPYVWLAKPTTPLTSSLDSVLNLPPVL